MFDFLKRKKNSQSFENNPENTNLSFSSDNQDTPEDCRMREVVYFSTDKECYIKTYIPERLQVIQKPSENEYNSLNSYQNLNQKISFENDSYSRNSYNSYSRNSYNSYSRNSRKKDTTKEGVDILNDILDLYFDMINDNVINIFSN
jgi:hypothetical protein